jgi:two-component system sensor histidine kinase HydH
MKPKNASVPWRLFGFSPWLLTGLALVLGLVILALAVKNTEKEKQFIIQSLLERGNALIWALEAGARTWMGRGENRLLQVLVEETVKQPGVIHLAVTDRNGNLLAYGSSDPENGAVSREALPQPAAADYVQWRSREGNSIFEVYRLFEPMVIPGRHRNRGGEHHDRRFMGWTGGEQNIFAGAIVLVGLDQAPFEQALADDFRNNALSAVIMGAMGLAGFLCLFWAHNYQRSRRLLKDSRALASEVVTSLPLGLITSDPAGKVVMVNGQALTMLALPAAADMTLAALGGLDWNQVIGALKRQEKVLEREALLQAHNGRQTPVSLSASRIYNEDNIFLGHLFILRDIGEVKRLQDELRRSERLSALGSLAAGVAHEIRNPLGSIKGLATYIAGKKAEGVSEAAKTMINEVNRLNGVVAELLEFARPGRVALSAMDVNQVAERALRLAEADIKTKQIEAVFIPAKTLPPVMLNQEKLTQALLNLFLNAVQAMEPGGKLEVTIEAAENSCNIIISDNGCGMSAEVQSAVFTPYFTTKPAGTGLGLAIVHQIIEAHQGAISLKSAPGEGSTFTVNLPVGQENKHEK